MQRRSHEVFPSITKGTKSQRSHTWSVSGTVKFSTWPLSFHSVLSCMLGTCTLTATGPWGEIKEGCNRCVFTQTKPEHTNKPCFCGGTLPQASGCPLTSSSCWQARPHEEEGGGWGVLEQHWGVVVEEAQGQTLHQKEEIEDYHSNPSSAIKQTQVKILGHSTKYWISY